MSWGNPAPAQAAAPAPAPQPAPAPAQADTVSPLFDELTGFDKGAKNPIDIYNSALEKLGISDARTRVTNLRQSLIDNQSLLDNLAGNVSGRTADSLVTEGQRQRLVATEAAPIANMGEQLNRQFSAAEGDYGNILGEAKTTTGIETDAQTARRQALMDRLKIQIDRTNDAEKKRQWQAEYDRQLTLDREAQANKDRDFQRGVLESDRAFNKPPAASGGGGGGGSSANPMQEFQDYIAGQFKSSGANPSRQTQDAWANTWFSSKGISNAARQVYWDAYNSTYNRPANPYDDWLYKR